MNFVFSKFSTNSNVNGYEVDNLPVPRMHAPEIKQEIASCVSKILEVKSRDELADTLELETIIENKVMDLYEFSQQEKTEFQKIL